MTSDDAFMASSPIDPTRDDLLAQDTRWRWMGRFTANPGSYRLKGIGRLEHRRHDRSRNAWGFWKPVEWEALVLFRPSSIECWHTHWTLAHGAYAPYAARPPHREGFRSAREARIDLLDRMLREHASSRLCVAHEDCRAAALTGDPELAETCASRDLNRMLLWEVEERTAAVVAKVLVRGSKAQRGRFRRGIG